MLLVKFPSRERPDRFKAVLGEWIAKCEDISQVHFLFSFDHDDPALPKLREAVIEAQIDATICVGYSENKVHAINRDMEHAPAWDHLIAIADDMWPQVQGWDTLIRDAFAGHCPDGDGLLWFPDGKQKDIPTLAIMGRKYYDRFGYIYHPSYVSVYCDNESHYVAKRDGQLHFVDIVLAKHRHPANFSDVRKDALYEKNETQAIWDIDKANYERRKANNFPNEKVFAE